MKKALVNRPRIALGTGVDSSKIWGQPKYWEQKVSITD